MLRKLMKYEFRATGRIMLPLFLLALLLAAGVRIGGLWQGGEETVWVITGWDPVGILLGVMGIGFILSLAAVFVVALVLMVLRFRSNLLSDEGYVMFTLPATVHKLLWAKLWTSVIWFLLAGAVDAAALLIASAEGGLLQELFQALQAIGQEITLDYTVYGILLIVELAILAVLFCLSQCLRFYAPMAIGYSFTRHKTLLSVLFFFLIEGLVQAGAMTLLAVGDAFLQDIQALLSALSPEMTVHGAMGMAILGVLVYDIVLYCLTAGMLHRRLNLE